MMDGEGELHVEAAEAAEDGVDGEVDGCEVAVATVGTSGAGVDSLPPVGSVEDLDLVTVVALGADELISFDGGR